MRPIFNPKAQVGSTKYGAAGMYTASRFSKAGISLTLRQQLAEAANHSLAKDTWSCYSTVRRHWNPVRRT